MIVLDASAAVELFARSDIGIRIEGMLAGQQLGAPAHFDAEVYAGLRNVARRDRLEMDMLDARVERLIRLPIERVPLPPLLRAAHALGRRISAADSFYVALARAWGAELVTCDGHLARAARNVAHIRLVSP